MADWRALVVAEILYFYALAPLIYRVVGNKLKRIDLFSFVYATGALLPLYVYTLSDLKWMVPVVVAHLMAILLAKEDGYELLMSPYPYLLGSSIMALIYLKSVVG